MSAGGGGGRELGRAVDQQRRHEAHPRSDHGRERRRGRPPDPGARGLGELDVGVAAVVGTERDQVVGGVGPEGDAAGLGLAVGELGQRGGVGGIEGGLGVRRVVTRTLAAAAAAAWAECRPVRGRGTVRLVATLHADHGVIDRRLDESHVENGLGSLLRGIAHQRGHGDRVPVGDHGRVAGAYRRWCRCGGRARCQGRQEGSDREGGKPATELRVPASGRQSHDHDKELRTSGLHLN